MSDAPPLPLVDEPEDRRGGSPAAIADTHTDGVADIRVRRAIVGTLLRAGRPMSVAEIIATILASRPLGTDGLALTPKHTSDVLRYQLRIGRVRRVRRGVYEAIPAAWSPSTAWRYSNWERSWDQRQTAGSTPQAPAG